MQIKTVQPIDMGQGFNFTIGSLTYTGRYYRKDDAIDLSEVVSYSLDSNDLEYHFVNFFSPVDSHDIFDIILAPTYPGVSPMWDKDQMRWGRCAADLCLIWSIEAVKGMHLS